MASRHDCALGGFALGFPGGKLAVGSAPGGPPTTAGAICRAGLVAAVGALVAFSGGLAWGQAQSFRRAGTEFNAVRSVSIPAGKLSPVAVVEFFHHGEIRPDARNVVVCTRQQALVPMRILQIGPGDFVRLAFQTVAGQSEYEIFYGGEPPTEAMPAWTNKDGLLLETRRYKDCDLNSFESVRRAFESSEPYGADYVESVEHARNPMTLKVEPFMSRYEGYLNIPAAGKYGFLTASQDASFLLIDGKVVVDAPGRHGPLRWATRGTRKDVQLSAGPHKFEYYHVAAGEEAIMVAAWEVNPPDEKPQPKAIPSELFRTGSIGRFPASRPTPRLARAMPDFTVQIAGDVPLPDNPLPLIGAMFRDNSTKALSMGARVQWDFGDGQTSDKLDIDHVYLRPGLYTVKLSFKRGAEKPLEIINRVYIDRPPITTKEAKDPQALHTLDMYLSVVERYDPKTLDAASLRQLVLVFQTKADEFFAKAEAPPADATAPTEEPAEVPSTGPRRVDPRTAALEKAAAEKAAAERENLRAEGRRYLDKAVAAARDGLTGSAVLQGDEDIVQLARLVGPMARDRLGDSQAAFELWKAAAAKCAAGDWKAECEIEAADIAVNDLLDSNAAKVLIDAADKHLTNRRGGPVAPKFQRVRGDYFASTGNGAEAIKAYVEAEAIYGATRPFAERTAWRGAHARSTEEFLQQGQLDRAAAELRQWLAEFPAAKVEGYVSLLYGRYWAAREKYAQAIAQAEQLQATSADSPYVDQLLMLAAQCEVKRGRVDRAVATLRSLLKDYPGSPLAPAARDALKKLETAEGK